MPVIFRASLRDQLAHQMNLKNDAIDEVRRLRARVAELEAMPEGWKVHSLKLDAMEAERDRYRRTLERLRDAEDCPAIVKAIVNESLKP